MRLLAILALAALAAAQPLSGPLIQPAELAARLRAPGPKPTLIHVGFAVLYRNKHLPASIYAGPGSTAQGIAALRAAAAKLPRDGEIVIYCGCCPWDHCPNMKPALEVLKQMGFTRVKALYTPTNLAKDWFDRGYPSESGEARQAR
jgi:thiosulfate/3-mercaptopyruvate sulfurtransferase